MSSGPSDRLRELGLTLPPAPQPAGSYRPVSRVGNLAWVAGQIAVDKGEPLFPGAVDRDVEIPAAQEGARRAVLQSLSALTRELGTLDAVRRPVRLGVFVQVSPGFHREHDVANGASDVLVAVFGEEGRPARTTVGVASLPRNGSVEVELLVEVV